MIKVQFFKRNNTYDGFTVSGHAGFAEYGQDIVCAGVTSAVQLTANAITEILEVSAQIEVLEDEIRLTLPKQAGEEAQNFIKACKLQLVNLAEDYPMRIKLTDLEV